MDISGEWSGIYFYSGQLANKPPIHFQILFSPVDVGGSFVGHITDANNIGEAVVTGTQTGNSFEFTKTYRTTRYQSPKPIFYQGSVSDDGLYLQGSWCIVRKFFGISLKAEGLWRAQRPDLPEPPLIWPPPPRRPDG